MLGVIVSSLSTKLDTELAAKSGNKEERFCVNKAAMQIKPFGSIFNQFLEKLYYSNGVTQFTVQRKSLIYLIFVNCLENTC